MCHHQKYVFNKYVNKRLLVNCGVCPECQQQKANFKAHKIKLHNQDSKYLCLFVTLTYSNKYVPYVKTSDLVNLDPFPVKNGKLEFSRSVIKVYRDFDILSSSRSVVTEFPSSKFKHCCYFVPQLRRKKNCTGIILWSDVQKFIKRLRINLKRKLHYVKPISYIAFGEYGSHSFRPHFHLLIYFPEGSVQALSPLIAQSWPFGDMSKSNKRIQVALDASNYLASYLNKSAHFPIILTSPAIRQKSSHSLHFGQTPYAFQLTTILENLDRGIITYSREVFKDGKSMLVDVPVPKFVGNRYFPKFKGYSSFTDSEILQLLRFPRFLWNKLGYCRYRETQLISSELTYSYDDFRSFCVRLNYAKSFYKLVTGKNDYDFAIDYIRFWTMRLHWINRKMYEGVSDFCSFYENANEFVDDPCLAPTLSPHHHYECNPNNRSFLLHNDLILKEKFVRRRNIRDLVNYTLSQSDNEF